MKSTQHDTSIFNVKSPELYLNMKESDIPKKGHSDRDAFVKQELEKCINGVKINGIFIPGSLYYDLNFHYIELDTEEGRTIARPLLRDNGWIIHNDYHQAQINKKHYCIGGSRQLSKSDTLTSLTLRELNVFDNTTAMLLVTNSQDKATFSGKMKIAHDRLVDFIKIPLLDKDFNKDFLRFGFKETTNDDELHAKLYIYNTDGGHNPEVGAGKVITFFAYDEIGKGKFKESWDAVIPAFKGAYGFRNSGFFAFTGGSVEKSQDAEKFFLNPKANGLLEINGTGRFMPGEYRADFKEKTSFVDYLSKVEGKTVKLGSELDTLNILYSPLDKAGLILDEEAEN